MILFNPSSLKRVAISIYNRENFYQQNFEYIPFLNVYRATIPSNTVKKFTPSFDFFNKALQGDLELTARLDFNYDFGLVQKLSIDEIKFYDPVDTFTWSKYIASPQNNVLKTSGSLSIPVILPYSPDSPNSKFLQQIWRLGVYWFVPFFLSTDVYPQNIGGPLFVKKFSISLSDSVSINLNFTGGSAYGAPKSLYESKNWIDFKNYYDTDEIATTGVGFAAENVGINTTYSTFRSVFRAAKNYDCLLVVEEASFKDSNDLNENLTNTTSDNFYTSYSASSQSMLIQGNNIYSMSLNIDNEIQELYTGNDGITKNILDGMRYISLKSRKVSGTIEFIASQNLQALFQTGVNKTLIMHFGGPFYFPMKNVIFEVFSLDISADNASYIHKINFQALLQESPSPFYYNQNEFDVNPQGLFGPPTGEIYVNPQDQIKNNNQ